MRPKRRPGQKVRVVAEQCADRPEARERRALRVHHRLDRLVVVAQAGPARDLCEVALRLGHDVFATQANLPLRWNLIEKLEDVDVDVVPGDLRFDQRVVFAEFVRLHLEAEGAVVDGHQRLALRHRVPHEMHEPRVGKRPVHRPHALDRHRV